MAALQHDLRSHHRLVLLTVITTTLSACPKHEFPPPGVLVDIGGQKLHLRCTGNGSPTVVLESGAGDYSVVWALVQPEVSMTTRVCSYDRAGYAWSEPGAKPRTFAQLALELHTALDRLKVQAPYVLVGQSYGGLVVRGFAAAYPGEIGGIVLVDAVHEDHRSLWGGEAHRLRDGARNRSLPAPRVMLDTTAFAEAKRVARQAGVATPMEHGGSPSALPEPLDRLPEAAQQVWRWADGRGTTAPARNAEMDWSPEEMMRMHRDRLSNRVTLGDVPLAVLARAARELNGPPVTLEDSLEAERQAEAQDLAALSSNSTLVVAVHAGHNIHIEEPQLVVREIVRMVTAIRLKN